MVVGLQIWSLGVNMVVGLQIFTGSEYGSRPTDMGVNMVVGLQIWWE